VVLMTLTPAAVRSEIPQVISYQGKVTDASGNPVTDGNYVMRFLIYDAETVGTELWNSGARVIAVQGGVFSVVLGSSPQPVIGLAFDEDYWLEVRIAGDIQSPRVRMGSVGYAYMASGLVPGTSVVGAVDGSTAFRATNTSASGNGIEGSVSASTGATYGVVGYNLSESGVGVFGYAMATIGEAKGVSGSSASTAGVGVYGWAIASTGTTYGEVSAATPLAARVSMALLRPQRGSTTASMARALRPLGGVSTVAQLLPAALPMASMVNAHPKSAPASTGMRPRHRDTAWASPG